MTQRKKSPQTHKSPYWRPDKPVEVVENERVEQACLWLLEHRMLSFPQWVTLLNRSTTVVKDFLRQMYRGYYLDRVEYPTAGNGRNPAIYKLDKKGVQLLKRLGYDAGSIPSQQYKIPHTLGIADVRIAVTQSIEALGWQLLEWRSEYDFDRDYHQVRLPGHRRDTALKPDGFFVVELPNNRVSAFFLEFDRDTENLDTFTRKVRCYTQFRKSGQFTEAYKYKGFRVLSVVEDKARRRLNNLVKTVEKMPGIQRRFWFTHIDDVNSSDPIIDPIWDIAGDETGARLFDPKKWG